jgi:hypothetical protein
MDGGSQWFTERNGIGNTPDGLLTFRIDSSHKLGWTDLEVIDPWQ